MLFHERRIIMHIASDARFLVGNTPLVRLGRLADRLPGNVLAKLEFFNPGHSVKDRIGVAMVDAMERDGRLVPGRSTIVEPTSGNTGIALAMVAAARDYRCILVMPDSVSRERRQIIRFLGAQVELTPAAEGMGRAQERAREILADTPDADLPDQFSNPANPAVHEACTAVELWQDTEGDMDIFVAGVGTGGTLTGVGRFWKRRRPGVRIVAVEPSASPVISGGEPGPHPIQGIGAGFIPENLDVDLIDEVVQVSGEQAFATARRLAAEEGILAGISTGAACHAALEVASRPENEGKTIVFVAPSTSERYLSTALFEGLE